MNWGWLGQGVRASVYMGAATILGMGGFVAWRAAAAIKPPVEPVCAIKTVVRVRVAEVLDGSAVRLSDGRKLLLSGIGSPRHKENGPAEPFAGEAKDALGRLVMGREIGLGDVSKPSKSGWVRAQLMTDRGVWVQGELVSRGFAWVRTFPDRRECAGGLLRREAKARASKSGLWALTGYTPRSSDQALAAKGRFGIVEGVVTRVANIDGRVFLNFGEDYRTDFTVHVRPKDVPAFKQAGANLDALEGKRLRVRGVVREQNGPTIDASVPEQIEVLVQ